MSNDPELIKRALASAVANRQVDDAKVDDAAGKLAQLGHPIRRIDICERGICLDFLLEPGELDKLPELIKVNGGVLGGVEVFPFGIINPDMFQVRVAQDIQGLR